MKATLTVILTVSLIVISLNAFGADQAKKDVKAVQGAKIKRGVSEDECTAKVTRVAEAMASGTSVRVFEPPSAYKLLRSFSAVINDEQYGFTVKPANCQIVKIQASSWGD